MSADVVDLRDFYATPLGRTAREAIRGRLREIGSPAGPITSWLPPGVSSDDIMRELRGRAPGDPIDI